MSPRRTHPIRSVLVLFAVAATSLVGAPTAHAAPDRSGLGCSEAVPAGVVDDAALQAEITRVVNEHRASIGVPVLQVDARLTRAAYWKTHDVHARASLYPGGIDHADPGLDGRPSREPFERAMTCGQTADSALENLQSWISTGDTAQQVLDRWLGSPGHRAQLEHPNHRYVGTAATRSVAEYAPGQGFYWTYAQLFSYSPSPASPACTTVERTLTQRATLNVDALLCRTGGSPTLVGAAPTFGTLTGLSYRAPASYGTATFTLQWSDTGVRQTVRIRVLGLAMARAFLGRYSCTARRLCTFGYQVRRPAAPGARALFQRQRLVGRRWVSATNIVLPRGAVIRNRPVRTTLARGTWRVRVSIARTSTQLPDATRWLTVRVA